MGVSVYGGMCVCVYVCMGVCVQCAYVCTLGGGDKLLCLVLGIAVRLVALCISCVQRRAMKRTHRSIRLSTLPLPTYVRVNVSVRVKASVRVRVRR